jgi:transcriptional regulator with XRE-family HTH domain
MTSSSPRPAFGRKLREWRQRAGLSQLELAARASTTARHVSFVETGRSRPGSDLVLRLCEALDLPLSQRNGMLEAAGLPHAFTAHALDDRAMAPIRRVLDRVLASHEPYPAWIYGRGLQPLAANRAGESLLPGLCAMTPSTIVDLWCAPGPLRALVDNWAEAMWAAIDSLRRELARSNDPQVATLLRRAERHARGVSRPAAVDPELPVACPRFRVGDRIVRTVAAVLRFDTAIDVTASELRVELMFPADDDSDAFFRERAQGGAPATAG